MSIENKDLAFVGGDVESKDLAPVVDSEDNAPAPEPRLEGIEVELIHHYTYEGKALLPGEVAVLPERLALSLVSGHYAKYV